MNRNNSHIESAEKILSQLEEYGLFNTKDILERAINIYEANSDTITLAQEKAIVESLKLFVEAYKIDKIEYEGRVSVLKTAILKFIALCNYKIRNFNHAYCIAKQGLDAIDDAVENSIISGVPREMYGSEILEELINNIEEDYFCELHDKENYNNIDPADIDLSKHNNRMRKFEDSTESNADYCDISVIPSKSKIVGLIEAISNIQSEFSKIYKQTGDLRILDINQTFDLFKMPLYFAWKAYKYGWHTDFCKFGESLAPFLLFETNCVDNTQKLISQLRNGSIFDHIEQGPAIAKSLIEVYTMFVDDLNTGLIKL